jgi:hypothetical protein
MSLIALARFLAGAIWRARVTSMTLSSFNERRGSRAPGQWESNTIADLDR